MGGGGELAGSSSAQHCLGDLPCLDLAAVPPPNPLPALPPPPIASTTRGLFDVGSNDIVRLSLPSLLLRRDAFVSPLALIVGRRQRDLGVSFVVSFDVRCSELMLSFWLRRSTNTTCGLSRNCIQRFLSVDLVALGFLIRYEKQLFLSLLLLFFLCFFFDLGGVCSLLLLMLSLWSISCMRSTSSS